MLSNLLLRLRSHRDSSDVIYEKLPSDIADRHVMLLDPLLTTGGTAVKAIQVRGRRWDDGGGARESFGVSFASYVPIAGSTVCTCVTCRR